MDKDYTSRNENDLENQILDDIDATETAVSLNEVPSKIAEKIVKLRETLSECTLKRRSDMDNKLLDVTCVRKNHSLISVYCEGKVVDEILEHQAFIIPDGTSRQGLGDLAGAVVKVNSYIRAFKCLQLGKGDRENWIKTIYHMLDHFVTASKRDEGTILCNHGFKFM